MRGHGRIWTAVGLVASIFGAADSADAAPSRRHERVALLPVVVEGELPLELRQEMTRRVKEALKKNESYRIISSEPIDGERCEDYRCIHAAARDVDAGFVVVPSVGALEHDYGIAVRLYDSSGKLRANEETTCEICSHEEATETLARQAGVIAGPLAELVADPWKDREPDPPEDLGPARLSIDTRPRGAEISIDGAVVGKTPLQLEVEPGLRDIVIRKEGYVTRSKSVRASRGRLGQIDWTLVESDDAQTEALRIVAWSTGIGSIPLLGAGVALLVLDEREVQTRCDGDNVDALGNCRYLYDTAAGGGVLTALGVAAAVTGITAGVIVYGRKRKRNADTEDPLLDETVSIEPLVGPGTLGMRMRF